MFRHFCKYNQFKLNNNIPTIPFILQNYPHEINHYNPASSRNFTPSPTNLSKHYFCNLIISWLLLLQRRKQLNLSMCVAALHPTSSVIFAALPPTPSVIIIFLPCVIPATRRERERWLWCEFMLVKMGSLGDMLTLMFIYVGENGKSLWYAF